MQKECVYLLHSLTNTTANIIQYIIKYPIYSKNNAFANNNNNIEITI